jgi:hypothetical protein
MAIWHFRFSLVPVSGVIRIHKHVPDSVEALRGKHRLVSVQEPNYWEDIGTEAVQKAFGLCLPRTESWGEAVTYGDSEGSTIRIDIDDEVNVALDVRDYDPVFVKKILDIAIDMNLLIVLTESGEVIKAEHAEFVAALQRSRAWRFCINPTEALGGN